MCYNNSDSRIYECRKRKFVEVKYMERPSKEYLKQLIVDTLKKFNDFECDFFDFSEAEISYIATKKRFNIGLRSGLSGLAEMKTYKSNESTSIRKNCQFYNKFYKDNDRIRKIECFIDGHDRLSTTYIAHYEDGMRFLFPFRNNQKDPCARHIFVATIKDGKVIEEYHIDGKQIVYEKYGYTEGDKVDYYYINYVPTGNEPVLGETEGYFLTESLELIKTYEYNWWENG